MQLGMKNMLLYLKNNGNKKQLQPRKYVNAKKQHAVFTFSIPVECVPLLSDALVQLVAEHKKLTK